MSPKSCIHLGIVGGESALSCELIKYMKEGIGCLVTKDTITTVYDSIKLCWSMKSKSIFLMDSLSSWDIFSPAKFYFIAISMDFWWDLNRMPVCIFCQFRSMMKHLVYLLFFYLRLLVIGNREPSTSSIDLKMLWKCLFKRGFLHYIENLPFDTIWSIFDYTDIDNTSWYCSSWYDNSFPRSRISRKACTSEDQFFHSNIWECLVLFHVCNYKIISRFFLFAWGSEKSSSQS